jgi:hypothetical protein
MPSSPHLKMERGNVFETLFSKNNFYRYSGEVRGDTYSYGFLRNSKGPVIEANLFKGYNRLNAFIPSPEDGKRSRFRNVVF